MRVTRRRFLAASALALLPACSGRGNGRTAKALAWGGFGMRDGQFRQPRAIGIHDGEVYVVDRSGRVQVFTPDGAFARKWSTPDYANGTPTSVTFAASGEVVIPDTHYSQILHYTRDGQLVSKWGAYGTGPDQFVYPTDLAIAPDGTYYFAEYGMDAERVHVFDAQHHFLRQWGRLGEATDEFDRAMGIALDEQGTLFVADSANHRIQCFDTQGAFLRQIGSAGTEPGQLKFPFDVCCAPGGTILVAECGNHRISRFRATGEFVASVGIAGRDPGAFNVPRGVAVSTDGFVFVADTDNHRVQKFRLEELS